MTDFLSVAWSILSFIIGILWGIVWFVLRDLLSTLLWVLIFVWLAFVLRHRSFQAGSIALLRYARYGAALLWRWVRGRPAFGAAGVPEPVTKIVKEYRRRIPMGYMSVSEQMNLLLIAMIALMASL
ncbi:MAG: hypothetical protein HC850_04185 [Rhodomicrobium sp.]|nr:hypothetical protein [Rhodomicrobium sp.]